MRFLLSLVSCIYLAGCASTAGPIVSNISYEAGGSLVIEKCEVYTNFFWWTTGLDDCNTHKLKIIKD
ncbi:MAG: hypothetical protein OXB84_03800 [Halobacteriovoraceae bacterium]|nr:hypothetical protein [Halobacteriovoraceae bacterium]